MPDLTLLVAEVQRCAALSRLLNERLAVIGSELSLILSGNGDKMPVAMESRSKDKGETTVEMESRFKEGNETGDSIPSLKGRGSQTADLVQSLKREGYDTHESFQSGIGEGSRTAISVPSSKEDSIRTDISSPLPDRQSLATALKAGSLKHASISTASKVASLIIHLAGQPTGNTQESLTAMLGYSTGGLAKLMINLRKRGLILRAGVRHYEPGPAAIVAMQQASPVQGAVK